MALNFKTLWRKKSRWSSITKMFVQQNWRNLVATISTLFTILLYHIFPKSYSYKQRTVLSFVNSILYRVQIISDLLINLSLFKCINFFFPFYNYHVVHLQIVWSVNFFWKLQVIALHTHHVTSTFQNKAIRIEL